MKIASHVRSSAAAMCILVFIAALSTALAQEQQKPIKELAREADVVAVGRVTSLKSEWDEGKTRIVTRVSLSVDRFLKQGTEPLKVVTIITLGGEVGDVGELYTHVPSFRQNEEVVVFLTKEARGTYGVAGGTQGVYIVEKDEASGQQLVAGKHRLEDFTNSVKKAVLD